MTRSRRWSLLLTLPLGLGACGSEGADLTTPDVDELTPELLVSDVASKMDTTVAFVSLHEGTVPRGATAVVSSRQSGITLSAVLVDGALDPVPVPAQIGDTLEVVARDSAGGEHRFVNITKRAVPPVVVRSSPSSGSTDVPLLNIVEVVFSEPMDPTSITDGTIRVTWNGQPVPGRVVLDPEGLRAEVQLNEPLARRTTYQLEVMTAARDHSGQGLPTKYVVAFATGNPAPADTTRFAAVSAGGQHTCALTTSAGLYCWGWNMAKQVTDGDAFVVTVPDPVPDADGATAVRAGLEHTCVVTGSGMARCWGDRRVGNSVEGLAPYFPSPFRDNPIIQVGAGIAHLCGVLASGQAECFGQYLTADGRFGIYGPDLLPLYSDFPMESLSGGTGFDCGLSIAGQAHCFGRNQEGQLGDGTTVSDELGVSVREGRDSVYIQFRTVAGGLVFSTLAVGLQHSCGIAAGKAYCWGSNSHGQLGIGATEPSRNVPTVVVGSEHYDSIAAGGQHTCAVASGRVFCWGEDSYGQLGDGRFVGTPVLAPVAVSSDLLFTSVSAGTDHTCAITTDAALYCWGRNDSGQLGDGSLTRASVPQLVTVEAGSAAASARMR